MGPSLLSLGAAAVLASTVAAQKPYQVHDSYDSSNFFDKWNFFVSRFDTGDAHHIDPTLGYVNYRSRQDAQSMGLIKTEGDEIRIGVDSKATLTPARGRDSVRLESIERYNEGLFIADFTHLPKPVCGSWPAFWMFGDPWPTVGELDIYEGWNMQSHNAITLHTDRTSAVGSCMLTETDVFTGNRATDYCDNYTNRPPNQFEGQGCSVDEKDEPWGSPLGGVYAFEWTDEHLSVWSWSQAGTPANARSDEPDPRTWGRPSFHISSSSCNIGRVLKEQKLIINIAFCGVTAGNPGVWDSQCAAQTQAKTCEEYVAKNPSKFDDVYWKMRSLKIFKYKNTPPPPPPPTTSTTSTSTSTSTPPTSAPTTTSTTTSTSTTSTPTTEGEHSTTSTSTDGDSSSSTSATSDHYITTTTTDGGDHTTTTSTGGDHTITTPPTPTPTSTSTSTDDEDCTDDETTVPSTAVPTTTTSGSGGSITKTVTTTSIYTVTSCKPTVTRCPYGQVTSEVIVTTTVCPGDEAEPTGKGHDGGNGHGGGEGHGGDGDGDGDDHDGGYGGGKTTTIRTTTSPTTTIYVPRTSTTPAAPTKPGGGGQSGSSDNNNNNNNNNSTKPPPTKPTGNTVTVNAGDRLAVSLGVAVLSLAAFVFVL